MHSYMSTGAFDSHRTLVAPGIAIQPADVSENNPDATQEPLIAQLRQRTGMNAQFAALCLAQNGWSFDTALRNFEEIKASIPAEAFEG